MFSRRKKTQSGWRSHSERSDNEGLDRLKAALGAGTEQVKDQVSTVFSSDTGRLLVAGDILLDVVSTSAGRTVLAVASLLGAWALI